MDIVEEGNIEGEIIPLTLSAKDMPEVLMLLTDLYSKPKLACFREYSTNAWDAHVEAGITDPIEILLPNALAPNLVIRDHGVGMSLDEIRNVFTQYGASTKREDDRLTGTLGMGCKSALAYCGQFTIKSVKDGWMILAQVSRKEDRTAALEVLEYLETNQSNGVEITIPRMNMDDFSEREAQDFFQYWREGTVLIDSKPPTPLPGRRLGENIILQDTKLDFSREQADIVVMGNVPYRLAPHHRLFDTKLLRGASNRMVQVICYVRMGSVVFTPSREDLMYTTETLRTLDKLRKEVTGRVKWMVQKDVGEAASHWEALLANDRWITEVGIKVPKLQYQGEDIPTEWTNQDRIVHFTRTPPHRPDEPHRCSYQGDRHGIKLKGWLEYQTKDGEEPLVIVGAPFDEKFDQWAKNQKRLDLRQSAKNQIRTWSLLKDTRKAIVIPQQHPDPRWLSELRVVHWNDIKDLRLPRKPKADAYCVPLWDKTEVPVATLPHNKLLYCEPDRASKFGRALKELGPGYTLVCLMPRRLDKFLRHRPGALPFQTVYKLHLNSLMQKVRQTNWQRVKMGHAEHELFRALTNEIILDPSIQEMIQIANQPEDPLALAALKAYERAAMAAGLSSSVDHLLTQIRLSHLQDRYPLIRNLDVWSLRNTRPHNKLLVRHLVTYLNAAYLTIDPSAFNPAKHPVNGHGRSKCLELVPYQTEAWWMMAKPANDLDLTNIPF
jgi:hypothetical protein